MKTQPFLTTTISLNEGLDLVREAINDERRRPEALRALQEWLDAIIGLSTQLVEPVVADALGHVAALQHSLTPTWPSDPPVVKSRERWNIRARIEPARRRLVQLETAIKKHGMSMTGPTAVAGSHAL